VLVLLVKWLVLVPLFGLLAILCGFLVGFFAYWSWVTTVEIYQYQQSQPMDAFGWVFSVSILLLLLSGVWMGIWVSWEFAPKMASELEWL